MTSDPIRDRFIHQVGELAGSVGLSRSVGQIYALLYMSQEPVSLPDIAEACSMSKGTASMSVRELQRWDAARKVGMPGRRADFYEANRDVAGIVLDRLREGMGRRLDTLDRAIGEAEEELEENNHENEEVYREHLREIEELATSLRRLTENADMLYNMALKFM